MTPAHVAGFTRVLIAPLALLLLYPSPYSRPIVIAAVIVAIVTDILDGYLARMFGTVSTFGIFLDLTADKVFVCGVLIVMSATQLIPVWIAFVVVLREFSVMGLRAFAAAESFVIPADAFGALKTIILFGGILLTLLEVPLAHYVLISGAAIAVLSGLKYSLKIWKLVKIAGVARPRAN